MESAAIMVLETELKVHEYLSHLTTSTPSHNNNSLSYIVYWHEKRIQKPPWQSRGSQKYILVMLRVFSSHWMLLCHTKTASHLVKLYYIIWKTETLLNKKKKLW